MFLVPSDYNTLIEFLVGAVVVSTYFAGKKVPYPKQISLSITNIWKILRNRYSGHIPSPDNKIYKQFDEGDWDHRTQQRIKDSMIVMIVYGAFSLFYCGNCTRLCCGNISYSITPVGIIADSVLILIYYIFQWVRYGLSYESYDRNLCYLKMALSIILFILSISCLKGFLVEKQSLHSIATITILCTCILPILVLLLYTLKYRYVINKRINKYIDELSCLVIALDVIEGIPDASVSDKIKGILEEVKKEGNKHKRLYLIQLCLDLAKDGIQYVSGVEEKDGKRTCNYRKPNKEEIDAICSKTKKWRENYYIKKMQCSLEKPNINAGVDKVENRNVEAQNIAQLILNQNEVFDSKIKDILYNIYRYGIPVENTVN